MRGEDKTDTRLLIAMADEARRYLEGHAWCERIEAQHFGLGIGGIVAVFLFEISNTAHRDDRYLWIIVGDLPSAYLVTDAEPNPACALAIYIDIMEDWADAVLSGASLDEQFPVSAPATKENAANLRDRLIYLRDKLLPEYAEQLNDCLVE